MANFAKLNDCLGKSRLPGVAKKAMMRDAKQHLEMKGGTEEEAARTIAQRYHDIVHGDLKKTVEAMNTPKPAVEAKAAEPASPDASASEEKPQLPAKAETPTPKENPVVSPTKSAEPIPPAEKDLPHAATLKPHEVLNEAKNVKLTTPKGARFLRVTDSKGRQIVEPIENVTKGANVFHQAGPFKKVESGILNSKKQFVPLKGEITATDANAPKNELAKPTEKSEFAPRETPKDKAGAPETASGLAKRKAETPARLDSEAIRANRDELEGTKLGSIGAARETSFSSLAQHTKPSEAKQIALLYARDNRAVLNALGIDKINFPEKTSAGSGAEFTPDSHSINISPKMVAEVMDHVRHMTKDPRRGQALLMAFLDHEVIHAAQNKVATDAGTSMRKLYTDGWKDADMPDDLRDAARKYYGPEWDEKPEWQKRAEAVRMIIENRWKGKLTEQLYKVIAKLKDFFKNLLRLHPESEMLKRQVRATEDILRKAGAEFKEEPLPESNEKAVTKSENPTKEQGPPVAAADAEKPATPSDIRAEIDKLKADGDPEGLVPGLERYLAKKEKPMKPLAAATPEDGTPAPREGAAPSSQQPSESQPDHPSTEGASRSLAQARIRDREYLKAVESGDMNAAQKHIDEAAKEAGFNAIGFHGSPVSGLKEFSPESLGENTGAKSATMGYFHTDSQEVAQSYDGQDAQKINHLTPEEIPSLLKSLRQDLEDLKNADPLDYAQDHVSSKTENEVGTGDMFVEKAIPAVEDRISQLEKAHFGEVYHNYLRYKNPMEIDAGGKQADQIRLAEQVEEAKNEGHDAVIVKNVRDAMHFGTHPSTVTVVFNPSQIKSADAVMRNDNGNVVPPSQRFNTGKTEAFHASVPEDDSGAARNEKLMEEAEAAGLSPSLETIKGAIRGDKAALDKLRVMIKDRTGKESINAAKPEGGRPYKNVPDSLMGFSKEGGTQKGFHDTNYPHTQPVRVTFPDGDTMVDSIKGMNEDHAIERAHRNWPDAKIEPATQAELGESLGAANPLKSMRDTYDSLADHLAARATKKEIAYKQDAVGNLANYHGQQAGDSIRLDLPDKIDREAMPFVIEAGGDKAKMTAMVQKIAASKDPKMAAKFDPIVDHAINNFDRLNKARANHDKIMADSLAKLKANGIDVGEVENYVSRKLDAPEAQHDMMPNPLFGGGGGSGGGSGGGNPKYFTKGRTFETLADAIGAGFRPKSTDLADLDAHRIEAAEKIIGQKKLFEELKATKSPTDGEPIIGQMEQVKKLNGKTEAQVPRGYSVVQAGGQPLVIHNDFKSIFQNLFGSSAIRTNAAGRALIKAAAVVKHGTLAVDTFHIGRMLFKMATAGGGGPLTIRNGHPAWNIHKGRALLEYTDQDLGRAQAMGDITKKEADYARANRPKVEKLMEKGMNVGKVADNLMEQAKLHLPIVSKLNSWIFGKLSRSAMLQASLVNLDRNLKNPYYTEDQAYRQTAKEMNELFGNLQNQGILQNKTLQDISRLIFLAPNWTESQFRNEARAYAQTAKAPINAARGRGFRIGNSARVFAAGLVALLAANQVINYLTRGKSTFENKEKDHKLDSWIPGGKRGFWFSPLEIAGEYAHAAMKYLAQRENPVDVATHIANNKLSPMARGAKEALTGRDAQGKHFLNSTDRFRGAVTDALPVPMFTQPFMERDPRSPTGFREARTPAAGEKQFLQSVGMKVTAAQSPRSQMFAIAQPYRADRQTTDAAGEYNELRRSLDNGDDKSAKSEIKWLYDRGKTFDQIRAAVGISKAGDIKPEKFAGNEDREEAMLRSLKPDDRAIYAQAQKEHFENAARLMRIIGSVPSPSGNAAAKLPRGVTPYSFK